MSEDVTQCLDVHDKKAIRLQVKLRIRRYIKVRSRTPKNPLYFTTLPNWLTHLSYRFVVSARLISAMFPHSMLGFRGPGRVRRGEKNDLSRVWIVAPVLSTTRDTDRTMKISMTDIVNGPSMISGGARLNDIELGSDKPLLKYVP